MSRAGMLLGPFEITKQKLLADNANRPVLHENISFDRFKKLSADRAIPAGASWVAALGIIYGPKEKT